jgi:hypothetical protein
MIVCMAVLSNTKGYRSYIWLSYQKGRDVEANYVCPIKWEVVYKLVLPVLKYEGV